MDQKVPGSIPGILIVRFISRVGLCTVFRKRLYTEVLSPYNLCWWDVKHEFTYSLIVIPVNNHIDYDQRKS